MAENSAIEWTHHTFNPWIGCTKISPACDHCYAEAWDARFKGNRWGPRSDRTLTKTWRSPLKWDRIAEQKGERYRVFCASLADVFDNHHSIKDDWRRELWFLVKQTPNLDWLMLTKRPQNILRFLPNDWGEGYENVWLGTTAENQTEFDRRAAKLAAIPARIRFLSMEPLLGEVDVSQHIWRLDWIIAGGESGRYYRKAHPDWFRSLRDQCANSNTPFLFKQWEGRNQTEIKAKGRKLDGVLHNDYPVFVGEK